MSTLYPQNNASRTMLDLGGVWDFRFHGDRRWQSIAVPASYNDQDPDPRFRNYAGTVEYRRQITVPSAWKGMRVCLRFDAVAHNARVLLNGEEIVKHRGGFLPFEVDLEGLLAPGGTAELTVEACLKIRAGSGLDQVALSGGVFQNTLLLEETVRGLKAAGFKVYTHSLLPPGDGGICVGQAAAAMSMINRK